MKMHLKKVRLEVIEKAVSLVDDYALTHKKIYFSKPSYSRKYFMTVIEVTLRLELSPLEKSVKK